ncbi:lipopolysaccharide biosynthesis protein [Thermaurantimonas aggregans]|uniref:lipopolysaccharide biosynthesis protein n=1 Tax=Thermaurantimonas aggregans TaxID=2173829 RepID=UPI0023F0E964|nr:polysaccharide biosynthesis C-terminal domain-containing protein [Thermaurantimonas aggregans]MCX8147773.1 polysaccharide biosynthesis C-terminal domain-containing protein [Thermaurantimonas aggregans]
MSSLRSLAGQTAIYGLSSIVGRFAYFLLTPLHTTVLQRAEMGINTDIYSWIAVLTVVLTLGMETTYFRFSTKEGLDEKTIFRQTFWVMTAAVGSFVVLAMLLQNHILQAMRYESHPGYLWLLLLILSGEVLATLPYARLRQQNKVLQFALIRLTNIFVNIGLNLYFFLLTPFLANRGVNLPVPVNPVLAIFLANGAAVIVQLLLLTPMLRPVFVFKSKGIQLKKILSYGLPVMLAGLPGIVNEVFDRQLLKYLLPAEISLEQMGVYAAVFRLSVFISLFIQAFRYAAEPFFFKNAENKKAPELYARVMELFVLVMAIAVVLLSAFLPVVKYFIHSKFWDGLHILPLLFVAQMLLGVIFNLNIWYKVTEKTHYGITISLSGAIVNLLVNATLIPVLGIMGAALALVISHVVMVMVSYYLSRKYFPIPYRVKAILTLLVISTSTSFLLFQINNFIGKGVVSLLALVLLYQTEKEEIKTLLISISKR